MKKFNLFLILSIIILSIGLSLSYQTNKTDINIDEELKKVATKEYFEQKLSSLVVDDNIKEANEYLDMAKQLNIKVDDSIVSKASVNDELSFLDKIATKSKDIYTGFVKGETENETQFYANIASDLTVVGDARDFYTEGSKLTNGEEYNNLVLGLSAVGLALSASQVATLGATTPLKVGASTLKVTAKTGKLSKKFIDLLSQKLSKTVSFDDIKKNVDFGSVNDAKKSFKYIENSIDLSHITKLVKSISTLKENTSLYGSTKLLRYIDSEKDLNKLVKISDKYKKNTKTVMKILGKKILKTTKTISRYSSWFLAQLFLLCLSFLSLIASFLFSKVLLRLKSKGI